MTLPLLEFAAGRKPRLRRAEVLDPLEIKLHCNVADMFKKHCLQDWRYRHINATAKDGRTGAIFKKMGVVAGWPDFELLSPRCVFHGLELKRLGEHLTDGQERFRAWVLNHGGEYEVARTLKDVIAICDRWGCLRIRGELRQ